LHPWKTHMTTNSFPTHRRVSNLTILVLCTAQKAVRRTACVDVLVQHSEVLGFEGALQTRGPAALPLTNTIVETTLRLRMPTAHFAQ
jgi:hypothetical protein